MGEEDGELCGIGEMNRVITYRIRNIKTKQCVLVNNSNDKLIDLGLDRGMRFLHVLPYFAAYGAVNSEHLGSCYGMEMLEIPLFDLNYDEEEENAVIEVLKSKWISSGPKCIELENKFCKMLDVNYGVAVSSCTAALHLALRCLGIGNGDEVIVPSLTFVATVNAVRYVGADPVFCDIENIDKPVINATDIERLITKKTKAVIVMHYAGFPCDMDKIMSVCNKCNIKVIEDACHGPMSIYHGKKIGSIGEIGCFSFFSNKNISTGEGGMLVTNNKEIFEKAKLLRSHGMTTMSYERASGHSTNYDVVELGYNYRMDDIRASIGIVQLDKLYNDIKRRDFVRSEYYRNLYNISKIIIPFSDWNEFIFICLMFFSDISPTI